MEENKNSSEGRTDLATESNSCLAAQRDGVEGQPPTISQSMAEDVWKVLVDRAGASESWMQRETFVHYATGKTSIPEYRFGGHLGMGGKVRIDLAGRWKVDCYPEDETDLRKQLIANTNHDLAELQKDYAE